MTVYTVPWFPGMEGMSGRRCEMPGASIHITFAVHRLLIVAFEATGLVEERQFASWAAPLLCVPESAIVGALRVANQLGLISPDSPTRIN